MYDVIESWPILDLDQIFYFITHQNSNCIFLLQYGMMVADQIIPFLSLLSKSSPSLDLVPSSRPPIEYKLYSYHLLQIQETLWCPHHHDQGWFGVLLG